MPKEKKKRLYPGKTHFISETVGRKAGLTGPATTVRSVSPRKYHKAGQRASRGGMARYVAGAGHGLKEDVKATGRALKVDAKKAVGRITKGGTAKASMLVKMRKK
jgi:hypothetical protein